jgi:hypothetical protein
MTLQLGGNGAITGCTSLQEPDLIVSGLTVNGDIDAPKVIVASGTNALPSYTFSGDIDTGLYAPAANTVGISTDGSERLRLDSAGNVGIGTSSPSRLLEIKSSAPIIRLTENTNTYSEISANSSVLSLKADEGNGAGSTRIDFRVDGSEAMRIDSAGNVGIGTSSPNVLLNVEGTSGSSSVAEFSYTGGNSVFLKLANASNALGFIGYETQDITFYNNNIERMRLDNSGNLNLTGSTDQRIRLNTAGAGGNDSVNIRGDGNNIKLNAATGTGNHIFEIGGTERMRIDSSGNVGIGTTSPNFSLDVNGVVGITEGASLVWHDTSGNVAAQIYGDALDNLVFRNTSSLTERMRIDSSGNLIIGATTPESESILTVNESKSSANYVSFENRQNYGWGVGIKFRQPMVNNGAIVNSGRIYSGYEASGKSYMQFNTYDGSEFGRLKIDSLGTLSVRANATQQARWGTLDGTNYENRENYTIVYGNSANNYVLTRACNTADGTPVFDVYVGGQRRIEIEADGDVYNANLVYGQISDIKLKENIIDSSSQWDDIKALRVRKFNFKAELGYGTKTQIGFVAQEVEKVSPGLVKTKRDKDVDGNDLGTETKLLKMSLIHVKAVKALQEAMERIEQLENRLAALENV